MEKFIDKSLHKIIKQGVGAPNILLYGENMAEVLPLQRAANQSLLNCGKHIVGGGFNTRNSTEEGRVYGDNR